MDSVRELTYSEAINEALHQAMDLCPGVFVMGQLVDCKPGVFGTTKGLADRFGQKRVLDFPVAESMMTFAGIGSALTGMRPILVHQRLDFMMFSLDAVVNWLALWRFKSNGQSRIPLTICAIVGKGWGQAAQHSKNLQTWFAHLPGLRVVVPATAYDAKGLLLESIFGENPTIFIEHRSLFSHTDIVPGQPYRIRLGRAKIRREGQDITIATAGDAVSASLRAAELLESRSVNAEVVDLRTLSPLDEETILRSVSKTGRLAVVDSGWKSYGAAAEIVARVCEYRGCRLRSPPLRICLPDSHTPMSSVLEEQYYLDEHDIAERVYEAIASST